jgi:hypothetical protein
MCSHCSNYCIYSGAPRGGGGWGSNPPSPEIGKNQKCPRVFPEKGQKMAENHLRNFQTPTPKCFAGCAADSAAELFFFSVSPAIMLCCKACYQHLPANNYLQALDRKQLRVYTHISPKSPQVHTHIRPKTATTNHLPTCISSQTSNH